MKLIWGILALLCTGCMDNRGIVKFQIGDKPYSTDTLDYDYFIHHQVFRSVLGSLVSVYSKGDITPFLATEWNHSENKTVWKFQIRRGAFFENGDEISPEIIFKSFCRMAYLQKSTRSNSGLLEYLIGYGKINNINSCAGISYDESSVSFVFSKPMENLLESISFGQYAVVHPNDYDEKGNWKDNKKVTSSSFYKLSNWNEDGLKLSLRTEFDFPIGHPKKAKEILVSWGEVTKADVKTSSSLFEVPKDYSFVGGSNSNIAFLRISSWKDKKFILNDRNARVRLRTEFYNYLIEHNLKPITSFFPKSIEGITDFPYGNQVGNEGMHFSSLKFAPFRDSPGGIANFLIDAAKNSGLEIVNPSSKDKYETLNPDLNSYVADVLAMGTGILIDRPDEDVRYMFLSKEGIRLPDETGDILRLLKEKKLNLQLINKHIFDQALIWPIAHFSHGILVSERVDTSFLNSIHPPVDFAFVGLK